jgi:hypothetical protein
MARASTDVRHFDFLQGCRLFAADFGIAIVAAPPDAGDRGGDFFVRAAVAQQTAQIVSLLGEQAGV